MSRAKLTSCWECGEPAPGGVCVGPHPGFQLRNQAGGMTARAKVRAWNVDLLDWWATRMEPPGSEQTEASVVTESVSLLHIRYDRGAHEKRLDELKRRLAAEREREAELAELHRLAEKYGMVLRPRLGSSSARGEVEHVVRSSAAPSSLGGGEPHEYPGPSRGASVADRRQPMGVS